MNQNHDKKYRFFRRLTFTTLVAVYFLILVGGIVRSTGSGMGCPDWPKCFGRWIPPTDVEELPENYKVIYAEKRNEKNKRLAKYLGLFGMQKTADKILNDKTILVESDFNKYKTWTEYINRVIGATIGLLIISVFVSSFQFVKKHLSLVVLSGISLLLVIFQGWIGSVVVSTNLLPWMVTVHMILAIVLLAFLILIVFKMGTEKKEENNIYRSGSLNAVLILSIFTLIVQIILGTQVREAIDTIAASFDYTMRDQWIGQLGLSFYIHRSFSLLVIASHLILMWLIYKKIRNVNREFRLSRIIAVLIVVEIITGVMMAYFGIPPFVQPVHLLLSTIIFGLQFMLLLELNFQNKKVKLMV